MDAEAAFGKLINGIAVLTVSASGRKNGMTVAWFTRVSHDPPLVMVSVGRGRHTKALLEESGYFCLNVLAKDQVALAKAFGFHSGRDRDKFAGVRHHDGDTGAPVIDGAAAYLECSIVGIDEAGDHIMFVGEVVASGASARPPLPSAKEDYA
jgi:flavin reductase (DIM6/NTAB) family NADH-FMN oxidoreductase RutF